MFFPISVALIGLAFLSTAQSATTTSSSATASPTFACPGNNGQIVIDPYGGQYLIACSSDTSGSYSTAPSVTIGFDDCFALCDNTPGCNAVSYVGGINGVGAGLCYIKINVVGPSAIAASANYVGLIRYVTALFFYRLLKLGLTDAQGLLHPLQHRRQRQVALVGLSK